MNDDAPPGAASPANNRTGHLPGRRSHRSSVSRHAYHSSRHGSHSNGASTASARRRSRALSQRGMPPSAVMEKVHAGLKKKLKFFTDLMAHLDMLVFAELCTLYYMDCSFFRLLTRAIAQSLFLSPKSDDFLLITPAHRPHIYAVFLTNAFCMLIHLLAPLTVASEASRGYLHGGVLIDFIGQRAPTSRLVLLLLDILILTLQCVMLAVHTEREKLRRLLMPKRRMSSVANALLNSDLAAGGGLAAPAASSTSTGSGPVAEAPPSSIPPPLRWPGQNVDSEERGVLAGLGSTQPGGPRSQDSSNGIELQPLQPPSLQNQSLRRQALERSNGTAPDSSATAAAASSNPPNTNSNLGNTGGDSNDDSPWESSEEGNIRDEDDGTPRRLPAEEAADFMLNSLSTGANISDFYVIHALREASQDYQGVAAQSLQTFGYAARLARIATERGARLATRPQPQ